MGERVVSCGAALPVGGVKQEDLLTIMRAESRARVEFLALHIEDHH